MIRVLLADDQPLVRTGFRMILDAEADIDVVGEAGDGADAVRQCRKLGPDVVVMDIRMPVQDGLGAAQRLFGKTGEFDRIVVKAAPGISAGQLKDRLASVLPRGDQAVTAASASASAAQQINSQIGILTDFFLGFAGLALFVGAFVIWNTFSILVGQRTRELGVLASVGPARRAARLDVLTAIAAE